MSQHSAADLLLHALLLRSLNGLPWWHILIVWVARLFTLSILFRTYIGPTVVSLASNRVRIRSISLRSIRGLYVKTSRGTLRVERIGLSYHRPSAGTASRFSVKVQGLSVELDDTLKARMSQRTKPRKPSRPTPSRLARRLWGVVLALYSSIYTLLEPRLRPTVRTFFVASLRVAIRALPVVTNGLDFELDAATVTHSGLPGIRFSVGYAKVHTTVLLAHLPTVVSVAHTNGSSGHRRFASVADWNARMKSSFMRTWDRAWGATQITVSVNLQVNAITGYVDQSSQLFAGTHRGNYFVDIPAIQFFISSRLNPHQGVEPRSVEMSFDLGKVNVQLDVLSRLFKKLKERRRAYDEILQALRVSRSSQGSSNGHMAKTNGIMSPDATSAGSRMSSAWRSPLSPSSPFMGALSASMRWRWAARQSRDIKKPRLTPRVPKLIVGLQKRPQYISYIRNIDVKLSRATAGFQPDMHPGASTIVLYATVRDVVLHVGLSHPRSNGLHKRWLGSGTGASSSEAYSVNLTATRFTIDRNGIGELMDHLRVVTLKTFSWDSLLVQWPAPWMGSPTFMSGDPNAQLLVSEVALGSVELSERLDMLDKLAPKEKSVEKTVHGGSLLPTMLSPVPRVSLGLHIGDVTLRLISPASEDGQEPFVLEAKTDDIAGSAESHFKSRPDKLFGTTERDYVGLEMEFNYTLSMNQSYAKVWFGPDVHLRGAHPQEFHAATYPNDTVLRVDSVHLGGMGQGQGEYIDEAEDVSSMDCSTEDIAVELWQPDVVRALSCIARKIGGKPKPRSPKPSRLSGAFAVGRFTVFDSLSISRGLSVPLRDGHCSRMGAVLARGHQRTKLALPAEHIIEASSAEPVRALVQLSLWNIVFRDAFATPFAADDPYGQDESSFLHVDNLEVNASISGQRPNGIPLPNSMDDLHLDVGIPKIYNALLAAHTLQRLVPPRPPSTPRTTRPPSTLCVHLQLLWTFPVSSKAFIRIASLTCEWDHILVVKEEFEEFVRLPRWRVELEPDINPLVIRVKGDSGRVRIPFDFVSVKNLLRMPPAEEAKRLGRLIVEAADSPLESRLGLIWKTGYDAARAFQAKVATIVLPKPTTSSSRQPESDYQFTSKHTVSIMDARNPWKAAVQQAQARQVKHEEAHTESPLDYADLAAVNDIPLLLSVTPPSFSYDAIPDFLYDAGSGLPRDTIFSLLIPMHINFTVSSLRLTFREYPLPLLHIPPSVKGSQPALDFDSDLVIAEEMGDKASVQWVKCEIIKAHSGIHGAAPLAVKIPKTIMPVKTYARPIIRVMTDRVTDFSWGVSYQAATQDMMRVLDTLSHAPRDSSPAVGFWDKLRLILHWRVRVLFRDQVHLHMKGSRNPYDIRGHGSGFALCWRGNPQLLVNEPNEAGELVQVMSDTILLIVPNIEDTYGGPVQPTQIKGATPRKAQIVCAKFRSGACFGVGFKLERACGPECLTCTGKPFDRKCRLWDFKPHYEVKLSQKDSTPELKSPEDSYNGFRSDFIHMSISLKSGLRKTARISPSNLHLSPEVFAHFWSWWHLFNSALSLPIRQGDLYPRKRPISPKFGQHLATLKYLIQVPQLFISHVYIDNSQDAWSDGVTPYVGVKALIDHFQVDMHQRDTESCERTKEGMRTIHNKPFYAVEAVLKGLDLRAMLAVFSDPLKQATPADNSPLMGSNYRTRNDLPHTDLKSRWIDMDDFAVDEGEIPTDPDVHLLPAVSCPRFTYFKRPDNSNGQSMDGLARRTKFGSEPTHSCCLGTEPSALKVQIELAKARMDYLKHKDGTASPPSEELPPATTQPQVNGHKRSNTNDNARMADLLNTYIASLERVDKAQQASGGDRNSSYFMPADMVASEEWESFDNVYQMHNPHVIMDNAIRDILMQYYYCSRSRRGFEYHMAQRAVKFIRDQAQAAVAEIHHHHPHPEHEKHKGAAQAVGGVMKKFFAIEDTSAPSIDLTQQSIPKPSATVDPLGGWAEGVSANAGHFCLLLKPQIVLRSTEDEDAVCILAAVQGKLKSFSIMDKTNINDPVTGKVMSRNFAWLTGLQTFSPSTTNTSGKDSVPLEVLIDLRADNSDFDRLVPQTDAAFQYDKFNRLRLRNDITSAASSVKQVHAHLQTQTDLVRVHVPRFTVSANDRHFQALSNIITNLVLFTDAAHKTRVEKLENLLFSYDFTNFSSAADVVAGMQDRLRHALETKRDAEQKLRGFGNPGRVELLKIDAHILLLVEELNLIFDAIKLAQDKANTESDQKSSLLLHASSEEVSWRMLDQANQLLAKLAVRMTDFYWLSRNDSSTSNHLLVGDLQAFDGAADAEWTEILSKYSESSAKQQSFLRAHWIVLPPVGGITIYEQFELTFHPMRLQIDIRVGRKIMDYLWPARRQRNNGSTETETEAFVIPESFVNGSSTTNGHFHRPSGRQHTTDTLPMLTYTTDTPRHAFFDIPSPTRKSLDAGRLTPQPLRKLGTSRSFSDLRNPPPSLAQRQDSLQVPRRIQRTNSSSSLRAKRRRGKSGSDGKRAAAKNETDDAREMKSRASQKTFVRVKFEELVDQFIPSGRNWRGWVKVAFQQPLVPVLPVARELITKTKWIASKKDAHHGDRPSRPSTPKLLKARPSEPTRKDKEPVKERARSRPRAHDEPRRSLEGVGLAMGRPVEDEGASEPEQDGMATIGPKSAGMRKRALSLFRRKNHSTVTTASKDSGSSGRSGGSGSFETDTTPTGSADVHRRGAAGDIRVPDEHERGIEGSQVNLALEEMEDAYSAHDRMDTHHHDDIVEHLDVIDPQISTVSTLTNAANAIVVCVSDFLPVVVLPTISRKEKPQDTERGHVSSIDEHSDEDALDRHVEDVLRKRDKFRRIMKGVWAFVKTLFWGTGIVLFLAKMINLHNDIQQGYWVELCQQVETGLFTATSIGFIPFRVMDSYRAYKIWHYKRIVAKRRAKAGLPELFDPDDLPDPVYDPNYVQVLTEKEQIDLHYQQHQFMLSQTWYRPHGTQTHRVAGIAAGVLIYYGGKNTRRTEVVEDRLRAALEMEHAHGRERDEEKNGLVNGSSSADGDGPPPTPARRGSTSLASPARGIDEVDERRLGLGPATSLQTAVGVDDKQVTGEDGEHGRETLLDLVLGRDTRRVDVVNTRADLVRVTVVLEGVEEFHVALRRLDGDDIGVERLDGREDVVEVGVAEVRVSLESVGDTSSGDLERRESPVEVRLPVSLTERELWAISMSGSIDIKQTQTYTLTKSRLINLNGLDASLLQVDDLVAEGEGELLALELTGDIRTREGPVEDSHRTGKHTLHRAAREALSVAAPAHSHRLGAADVGDDNGGTNVAG
ncbi:golgi-body localization protein domain-containing protein [Epithele typhae]|uniref:golgi-body localization protein domain-containing protein n=1 Tax=Epithele typhae TaxID=378194 RepID=UPI002008598E|nr:golgi-body localization protein domain-containing protein [Epithele typhae]KAH9943489.1 golgi-body localization protein domain-containing protein [Epithele typhae]